MNYPEYKAMCEALQAGTATPAQQQAAIAYIERMKFQHARELRDAYHEGRSNAASEARGEPLGTY